MYFSKWQKMSGNTSEICSRAVNSHRLARLVEHFCEMTLRAWDVTVFALAFFFAFLVDCCPSLHLNLNIGRSLIHDFTHQWIPRNDQEWKVGVVKLDQPASCGPCWQWFQYFWKRCKIMPSPAKKEANFSFIPFALLHFLLIMKSHSQLWCFCLSYCGERENLSLLMWCCLYLDKASETIDGWST